MDVALDGINLLTSRLDEHSVHSTINLANHKCLLKCLYWILLYAPLTIYLQYQDRINYSVVYI